MSNNQVNVMLTENTANTAKIKRLRRVHYAEAEKMVREGKAHFLSRREAKDIKEAAANKAAAKKEVV